MPIVETLGSFGNPENEFSNNLNVTFPEYEAAAEAADRGIYGTLASQPKTVSKAFSLYFWAKKYSIEIALVGILIIVIYAKMIRR